MCTQTMAILLCNFIRINLIKLFEKYVVLHDHDHVITLRSQVVVAEMLHTYMYAFVLY